MFYCPNFGDWDDRDIKIIIDAKWLELITDPEVLAQWD